MATLTYYFDFVSPYTYLAQTQLPALLERTGSEIEYKPILLGALHKSHEMVSPAFIPAKASWLARDCKMWAKHYDVPMKWCKPFPFNSLFLQRAAAYVQQTQPELMGTFVNRTFQALWEEKLDSTDPQALGEFLQSLGLDAEAVLAATQQDEIKNVVKANTSEAKEVGLFGAPGFVVGEHVLFGQDRLHFVEAALNGQL